MVMMVMMAAVLDIFYHTVFFMAMLFFVLKLKCCMNNTVFTQFMSYFFFNLMVVAFCYNMHCGINMKAVHTPYVNMVNINYTVNATDIFLDFGNRNSQKQAGNLLTSKDL